MSTFAQDGTGDLSLTTVNGGKTLTLITNKSQCAAQKLTNRFLFWQGEWFLDTREGFPFQQVFGLKNPDLRAIKQMLNKVVLSVPWIASVEKLQLTLNAKRQASMALSATTNDGAKIVGGQGNQFIVQ